MSNINFDKHKYGLFCSFKNLSQLTDVFLSDFGDSIQGIWIILVSLNNSLLTIQVYSHDIGDEKCLKIVQTFHVDFFLIALERQTVP